MNILIPHSWLLEHLETEASPEKIQEYLSLAGPSVEAIYQKEGDSVYDIEVTTNRVDAMSIRGIAREASVILEQFGVKAKLKPNKIKQLTPATGEMPLPKIVNNDGLCKRVTCVLLKDVKRNPTPEWMADRLKQIDQNIHDAVIDITNYVTHEQGHPIHAFDYDSLMKLGGKIIIKEAEKGNSFETLDGETYETVGGEVVFENDDGLIIDLPAIKGTTNTSINETTKNVLLWIESVEPMKIRQASMTHSIRTVAAQLSEKGVDANLAEPTLLRAVELYQELCDATIASELYDYFPGKKKLAEVRLPISRIDEYLGIEIETKRIIKILEDLECEVKISGQGREAGLTVQPPTFRGDIAIPADVIEEVARIYGYHNLPSTLMKTAIPTNKPTEYDFDIETRIKRYLSAVGWQEIYSYSLVSEELAIKSGNDLTTHLKLKNPLTDDKVYLRRSLLPSLEEIINYNSQREQLSVFELANVYHPQKGDLPQEDLILGILSTDDYRQVRGQLTALLDKLFINEYQVKPSKKAAPEFSQSAEIIINQQVVGELGVIKSGLIGINLHMLKLLPLIKTHPEYQPIPKTMVLTEDMTFTIGKQTAIGEVMENIGKIDSLIKRVSLKDVYQRNYTFSIEYHDASKNLTVIEVEPVRKKIASLLKTRYQAELVGQV